MENIFFTIDCKTNMHVGSGKANFGVIDQLVQRDPTFHYPVIHASSLKGGIKEHCYGKNFTEMVSVFGSTKKEGKTDHDNSQVGEYKFFDALLLCIPVRCDKRPYIHITCPMILSNLCESLPEGHLLKTDLLQLSDIFSNGGDVKAFCFSEGLNQATIEDFDVHSDYEPARATLMTTGLKALFKHEVVVVNDKVFETLTNDLHLPVIARNYLENGESKNLWYEQVVPRLSRFWSHCIFSEEERLFKPVLLKNGVLVQIGANGSIGYGYCSFTKF